MYLDFFHFARPPFANTADPLFFYPSAGHREALATLLYGILERKGLCVLTGPVGSGKTMVLRKLMHEHPEFRTVLLANPWLGEQELFARLIEEWGDGNAVGSEPLSQLNAALLAEVRQAEQTRFVLLADEAHLLSQGMLEAVRLLLNLEEERGKLVQIVLSGQEELAAILRQHHLRPLLQRVALVEHLRPFDLDDTIGYVQHRLRVAGGDPYLFPRPCLEWIHRESRGIPRLINQICDHSLIFAFGRQSRTVERQDVEAALAKLPLGSTFLEPEPQQEAAGALRAELSTPPPSAPAPESAARTGRSTAPPVEPPRHEAEPAAEDVPGLASVRPAGGAEPAGATPTSEAVPTFGQPPLPAAQTKEGRGWLAQVISIVVALLLGAGVAWWWLTHKAAVDAVDRGSTPPSSASGGTAPASLPPGGAEGGAPATVARPAPPAPSVSSPSLSAAERDERLPSSLPLPVASRFAEITVSDAKGLLAAISNHFGADNTTVRDLFAAMNPGIVVDRLSPTTRVRLPQLRREEMIVADTRGRFYIYYATLADDQQAVAVKQRLTPLGASVVQIPVNVGGQTVVRLYVGPFTAFDEAARVVELLRFTFVPLLERGEGASGS